MKLTGLINGQKVIVQLLWGEQMIEFQSRVIEHAADGIYVGSYLHNGQPLELEIGSDNKVVCNLFADNLAEEKRVSWKNVDLKTTKLGDETVYLLSTKAFNRIAKVDDRRKNDRIVVQKQGLIIDEKNAKEVEIIVFDISDTGVSFYAPKDYNPPANRFIIQFTDQIGEHTFPVKIECEMVREKQKIGLAFFGCRIVGENREYLLYACNKRLDKKRKNVSDQTEAK